MIYLADHIQLMKVGLIKTVASFTTETWSGVDNFYSRRKWDGLVHNCTKELNISAVNKWRNITAAWLPIVLLGSMH